MMTIPLDAAYCNGQDHSDSSPVSSSPEPIRRRHQGTKEAAILAHLQSGRSINSAEAKRLYGCRGLSGTISRLRLEHDILTIRQTDENGDSIAAYRMNLPAAPDPDEPPLFDLPDDPASLDPIPVPEDPTPVPEIRETVAQESVIQQASPVAPPGIDTLTVRWTPRGPELQVVPAGGDGSEPFHVITRSQARYLFENMRVILEAE